MNFVHYSLIVPQTTRRFRVTRLVARDDATSTRSSWTRALTLIVGAHVAWIVFAGLSRAESCAQDITAVQAEVDSALESTAAAGPALRESPAATLHHQPTPAAIARAEGRLDETSGEQALAALARAREVDRAGDSTLCRSALAYARRAIGHAPN